LVRGFGSSVEVLLDGIAGEVERSGDGTDALAVDQVSATNLADGFHAKHPGRPPPKDGSGHTRGGQTWTLITPETWSLLHAVLQSQVTERGYPVAEVASRLGVLPTACING
jgi:hypothetical protein